MVHFTTLKMVVGGRPVGVPLPVRMSAALAIRFAILVWSALRAISRRTSPQKSPKYTSAPLSLHNPQTGT